MGRKLRYFLEFLGFLFLLKIGRLLPRPLLFAFGRGLGRFTFSLLRLRREVTLDNMQHAFPEKSASDILDLGERCYEHFGITMLEYLRMPGLSREDLLGLVDYADSATESDLDRALHEKTGAIVLTAHIGNWEYLGAWLAGKGYPVSFISQPQNNPYVDRYIQHTRKSMGMHLITRGSMELRGVLRALRQRRFVALLPDQDAGRDGIFVPFFGRPASTARGAAAFALKTGVPIIITFFIRKPEGRYTLMTERLRFNFPHDWDEERKLVEITSRYTKTIENYIRRHPEQWLWLHRRWKNQPRMTGAHAGLHA